MHVPPGGGHPGPPLAILRHLGGNVELPGAIKGASDAIPDTPTPRDTLAQTPRERGRNTLP
eukprot:4864681-Pyramimonas_sp.AAC.1